MDYFSASDETDEFFSDEDHEFGGYEVPSIADEISRCELWPEDMEDILMDADPDEFEELADGSILRAALMAEWPKDALQGILSAMGCRPGFKNPDALHLALHSGIRGAVELFSGEEYAELFSLKHGTETKMMALVTSRLVRDREIVDLVARMTPAEHFAPSRKHGDVLAAVLESTYPCDFAVAVCLRRGPLMADRMKGRKKKRLMYVTIAARSRSLAMVEKLHGLVPLLPDGSGRRCAREEYAAAISAAVGNPEERLAIMQFLVDAAGEGDEELVSWTVLLGMEEEEEAKWLLDYAPHLLTSLLEGERKAEDTERCTFCEELLKNKNLREYVIEYIRDNTSRRCIENLLASTLCPLFSNLPRRSCDYDGWRWKLKPLFDEVPEAWRGQQREALFHSIRHHHSKDVEYLLTVCTPADLRWQNGEGDTGHTLAKRLGRLPGELVEKLKVAAKNPYA